MERLSSYFISGLEDTKFLFSRLQVQFSLSKLQHGLLKQQICKIQYSRTCIQRLLKESNENDLLQQVVYKCRFY